jgi:hypothetical protein
MIIRIGPTGPETLPCWAICVHLLMNGGYYTKFQVKVNEKVAGAAGGRNEETYSKYAEGIRVEQYPSRRQQQQILFT